MLQFSIRWLVELYQISSGANASPEIMAALLVTFGGHRMSKRAQRFGWAALLLGVLGVTVYTGAWNVLAKAAIPAAVALVFGLARRCLPARAIADRVSPYSMPALNEQFRGRALPLCLPPGCSWYGGNALICQSAMNRRIS